MKYGDRAHCFDRGWLRWFGSQWVPEAVYFFKIKVKGLR